MIPYLLIDTVSWKKLVSKIEVERNLVALSELVKKGKYSYRFHLEQQWLLYTTIGRADLIYFENWRLKHKKENFGEINTQKNVG